VTGQEGSIGEAAGSAGCARSHFGAVTWNLFHGRDKPPGGELYTWRSRLLRVTERSATHVQVNRPLLSEFARYLDSLDWQIALLQEAPPRWLEPLGRATRASGALALTSRNWLAPLRRAIGARNPDLIASNEGGSNMVLVRAPGRVEAVQRMELTRDPERRTMLLARVRLAEGARLAVASMHLSVPETGRSAGELLRAAERAVAFAGGLPLLLGGDLNLRAAEVPGVFEQVRERYDLAGPTAPRAIDHLLVRGLAVRSKPTALKAAARELREPCGLALRLSDHAPVTALLGMR